jgi:TonB family protein
MQLGDLVRKVVPDYPTIAKQLGIQGSVLLTATVGKDGRVEHVQVVSGPPLLVHSAKQAVEQWQYSSVSAQPRASRRADADHREFCLESGMNFTTETRRHGELLFGA